MQPSFFDLEDRYKKLDERDALIGLDKLVDWEAFRETLQRCLEKPRKSVAGRKAFDVIVMFKALLVLKRFNYEELAFQIRDRYSFCRFLGLNPEDRVPAAKTIGLFRKPLTEKNLIKRLFEDSEWQLEQKGFKAHKGQIVDASLVNAPIQRNSRKEKAPIKRGKIPQHFEATPPCEAAKR